MRVGISTSVIQRGRAGIGQYLAALLKALVPVADGTDFVLFVLQEDLPLFQCWKNRVQLVPVAERFRRPLRDILWHQVQLPRLAKELNLDVLHVPSYRRLLWRAPCPRVATIHDLAPFEVRGKYSLSRMLYGKVVARQLARRQDRIIAISGNTARDIERYFGIPGTRVEVIYNGIDHERFYPGNPEESRRLVRERFALEKPFIVYVARLEHPGKNHVRLVAAYERFKAATGSDWQLVFAGGDWPGAAEIHRARRESRFASEIRSLGFVPDVDLPDLYRAASVFIYPSLYEGFGMPPLEAMACGCPVICSERGALWEVTGKAAAVVDPESIASMAGQLSLLCADSGVRERLRAMGLTRASQFDWAKTAAATFRVYKSVCRSTSITTAREQVIR